MQPYFFPYLGHFSLIAHCDMWVVFDITQFTPKTFITRNEILKGAGGRQRIGVDLSNSSIHIRIKDATLLDPVKTRDHVLGGLTHYKRRAPYYEKVRSLVWQIFESLEQSESPLSLVQLNILALLGVCEYLALPFRYKRASQIDVTYSDQIGSGDWAPEIACHIGAKQYLNPIGGSHLFDPLKFHAKGVELQFLDYIPIQYSTPGYLFEPNLSILDVMMWLPCDEILDHLKSSCRLVNAIS